MHKAFIMADFIHSDVAKCLTSSPRSAEALFNLGEQVNPFFSQPVLQVVSGEGTTGEGLAGLGLLCAGTPRPPLTVGERSRVVT